MHKNSHCDNFARPPISSIRLRAVSWLSDVGCPGHASGSAMSTMDPSGLTTKSQLPSTEPPQFTTKPLLSHGGSPRGRHDRPRNRGVRTEQPAVRHAVVAGPSSSRHGAAGPATRSPRSATEPQRTARSRHASHGAEWNELLGCTVLAGGTRCPKKMGHARMSGVAPVDISTDVSVLPGGRVTLPPGNPTDPSGTEVSKADRRRSTGH